MIRRSLNEPGSPSAPLTTTVLGNVVERLAATVRHFVPVGNPAPPRPRNPDASIVSMTASAPTDVAASSALPPPAAIQTSREGTGSGSSTRGVVKTMVVILTHAAVIVTSVSGAGEFGS